MESPSTSGSTTTGPATFAEAFAADASSASTPVQSQTATASASADTTSPPAAGSPDGTTPAPGEPPKERWADILDNARTKAREEAEAQWQPYAWAKQVSAQEYQQVADLARRAQSDPIAYLQDFIKELRSNPTYDAQLKSLAARALAQRTTAQPTEPQLETIPVELPDGRVVNLTTADSQAKREAWFKEQLLSQVKQDFQPVTETIESLKAKEQQALQQQTIARFVESTQADVLTWPGMSEQANQKAVAEELGRAQVDANDPQAVQLALNAAYRKVVLPSLQSKSESAVLDDLKRKAVASTSVNPGSAAASAPANVTSFYDKSLSWR